MDCVKALVFCLDHNDRYGGPLALIGKADQLIGVAIDLNLNASSQVVWEIKLLLLLFFLTNAF